MNIVVVIVISAVILGLVFKKTDRPLAVIFTMAYLLRLLVMYADYYHLFGIPFSGTDTEYFHRFTLAYMHEDGPPLTKYTYVLAFFYTVFGDSGRFMAQFFNVLLSFGALVVLYRTLRMLDIAEKKRWIVVSVLAFMPVLLCLSGILLRESWILFFLTTALCFFVRWYQRGGVANAFVCIAAVLAAMEMHAGCVGMYLVFVVSMLVCRTWKKDGAWQYVATIGVIILSVLFLYAFPSILLEKFARSFAALAGIKSGVAATATATAEAVINESPTIAGSTYLLWMDELSMPVKMLLLPLKMVYLLFSPLPPDWRNLTDALVFFTDSLVYVTLVILMFRKPLSGRGFRLKRIFIYVFLLMTLLFCTKTSNAGTAVRHRSKFLPVLLLCVCVRKPVEQVSRTWRKAEGREKFFFVTTIPRSLPFFDGQYELLCEDFDITAISSLPDELRKFGESHDVKTHCIPMERDISLFKDLRGLALFIRYFRKERPYIVHGNTPKGSMLSMIAARMTRVPVRIYMCHGLRYQGFGGFKRQMLMMAERVTCSCATDVMCVSKGVAKVLHDDRITRKQPVVVWNGSVRGINVEKFDPDKAYDRDKLLRQYSLEPGQYVLTFVGRIARDKGVNELVEAFSTIHAAHPETRLLLIGKIEREINLIADETLHAIENDPAIIAPGQQDNIPEILSITNIFVLPSYREGFGMSLMEAGAMGVPAVATDIIGCNEVVEDGKTGILIPPQSAEAIVDAVERLRTDPGLYSSMRENCRKSIIARYEQKELWKQYREFYLSKLNDTAK